MDMKTDDEKLDRMVRRFVRKHTGTSIDEWLRNLKKQQSNRMSERYAYPLLRYYVHTLPGPTMHVQMSLDIDPDTLALLKDAEFFA